MTTSDATRAADAALGDLAGLEGLAALQAGLPDPAALARLANAMFVEAPAIADAVRGAAQAAKAPLAAPAQPVGVSSLSLPSAALPSAALPATGVPGEADLRALATSTPTAPAVAIPGVPGIPGGFSAASLDRDPSFGFLHELRPLFAALPAAPIEAVPATGAPVLPAPPAVPAIPGAEAATPQLAGAVPRSLPADLAQPAPAAANAPVVRPDAIPVLEPLVPATPQSIPLSSGGFDVAAIRRDFPILSERVNGRPLVWLDNAATTQKPQAVIDRLAWFYQHENSNIHRAAHTLAARATDAYEAAREKVRRFLKAGDVSEIVFVRGATEGINLVAQSWGRRNVQKDDEIVVTHLEHHANIVPWQMLCAEKGARLRVAPVDDSGQIILDEYERLLGPRTRLVSIAQVSNALGTVVPVQEMTAIAHRHGAKVLVDGAQSVSHMAVDVQTLGCDFFVFSGHKVFAPTGIGAVFGRREVLDATPPWQGGGNMIADVTFERTVYNPPPFRFEAGTGNIADAVGLGAAIDYVERIGMANISRYEHDLLVYGTEALRRIPGLRLIGTAADKASVLSFVLDGFRTEEVGSHLSREGIAVRSGHHCAQPILRRFGVESTVRPSLAFYNTCEEIDALVAALWNLKGGRTPGPL